MRETGTSFHSTQETTHTTYFPLFYTIKDLFYDNIVYVVDAN